MRRLPPAVWILAPLGIGLAYWFLYGALAPTPTLANLPPEGAILVQRFRDRDALNENAFGARGPDAVDALAFLGLQRNVPGLVGVDMQGPIHLIQMRELSPRDASMVVFPLSDAEAFDDHFHDLHLIERGYTRHAQHLEIRGRWAAVGGERHDVRRIGTGGITVPDLGEDHALAARIPELVDHAMARAREAPWPGVLRALGVDPSAIRIGTDPETGRPYLIAPGDERVRRIKTSWSTARMWIWKQTGRVRIDLEPTPGLAIAEMLAGLHAQGSPMRGEIPTAPDDAQVWLALPNGSARRILAHTLHAAGVRLLPLAETGIDTALGATAPEAGGLLVWGVRARATGGALVVGLAARAGELPPMEPFLPNVPAAGETADLPEGAAPLTLGDTKTERPSPAGEVRRSVADGIELLAFGRSAGAALEAMEAHRGTRAILSPPAKPQGDLALVAWFAVHPLRAPRILLPCRPWLIPPNSASPKLRRSPSLRTRRRS